MDGEAADGVVERGHTEAEVAPRGNFLSARGSRAAFTDVSRGKRGGITVVEYLGQEEAGRARLGGGIGVMLDGARIGWALTLGCSLLLQRLGWSRASDDSSSIRRDTDRDTQTRTETERHQQSQTASLELLLVCVVTRLPVFQCVAHILH